MRTKLDDMLSKLDYLRKRLDVEETAFGRATWADQMNAVQLSDMGVAKTEGYIRQQAEIERLKKDIADLEEAIAEERGNPGFRVMFGKWWEDAYPRYKAAHPGVTYKTQVERVPPGSERVGREYVIEQPVTVVDWSNPFPSPVGRLPRIGVASFEKYAYGTNGVIDFTVYLAYAPEIDTIFWTER